MKISNTLNKIIMIIAILIINISILSKKAYGMIESSAPKIADGQLSTNNMLLIILIGISIIIIILNLTILIKLSTIKKNQEMINNMNSRGINI